MGQLKFSSGAFILLVDVTRLWVEEKLNAAKYRDSLNENPVQSIQNLRRAEGLPSNRTMDLNTQQEWLIDNNWD